MRSLLLRLLGYLTSRLSPEHGTRPRVLGNKPEVAAGPASHWDVSIRTLSGICVDTRVYVADGGIGDYIDDIQYEGIDIPVEDGKGATGFVRLAPSGIHSILYHLSDPATIDVDTMPVCMKDFSFPGDDSAHP